MFFYQTKMFDDDHFQCLSFLFKMVQFKSGYKETEIYNYDLSAIMMFLKLTLHCQEISVESMHRVSRLEACRDDGVTSSKTRTCAFANQ